MRQWIAAILAGQMIAGAGAARGDSIIRRTREGVVEGTIRAVNDAGVTIQTSEFGAQNVIAWDRIERVVSDPPRADVQQRLGVAIDLWRARSRVERGDLTLAEPLFEKLFKQFQGSTHETALVVAEGLLRCRLDRMEHALAVIPALETARLRRASVQTQSYEELEPVLDAATMLCPLLAPAWVDGPLLARLENELATYDARGDEVIAALAALYLQAVRQGRGEAAVDGQTDGQPAEPPHPGIALLAGMVRAEAADPATRREAREGLRRQLDDLPPWAEAWARFQIGAALARDGESLEQRELGIVHLLHLPARHGRTQPFLAGLALDRAAAALERQGAVEAAAALRAELASSFPGHPILGATLLRTSNLKTKESG